jgi:hypothetical protein
MGWVGARDIWQKVAGSASAATGAHTRRPIRAWSRRVVPPCGFPFYRAELASSHPQLDNSSRPSLVRATGSVIDAAPAGGRDALGELSEPLAHMLADRLHFRMTERH